MTSSGLGIGTTPSALIAHGIKTTIIEIDPVVHKFSTKYFNLPPNQTSIIEDAVSFVERAQRRGVQHQEYNYIIHDVFTGGAEPVDLFTEGFLKGLSHMLASHGVIAIVSWTVSSFRTTSMYSSRHRITPVICCPLLRDSRSVP